MPWLLTRERLSHTPTVRTLSHPLVALSNETATAAAVLVLALVFVGLGIADLVRVIDEDANNAPSWNKRMFSCRDRIVKAVPLTAIKIILVSWQIVTQVG